MNVLTKADGSAFEGDGLSEWCASAIEQVGLPDDCVMHGLRETATKTLAELGCSSLVIASITGHRSLKEIERYTREADQKRMRQRQSIGWNGTETEPRLPNVPDPGVPNRNQAVDATIKFFEPRLTER